MKLKFLFLLSIICLSSCSFNKTKTTESSNKEDPKWYGVFLGAKDNDIDRIAQYKKVMIDMDEFSDNSIYYLKDKGCEIYAYLSVGSLEKYRSYYNEYKSYTFMDYENWPDERWIDVSKKSWQNLLKQEAQRFKKKGASGLFMDNFDVYYIAKEEYDCSEAFQEGIYTGCFDILSMLSTLDLNLVINSGTDFLERLNDELPSTLAKIECYTQECVYSSIEDYEGDVFSKQDKETQDYYKNIISFMKYSADILLLEYTVDESLIKQIKEYCDSNNFYYYISNTVDLK